MVGEVYYQGKKHYYCEDCKLVYAEKDWAEKCEKWCEGNESCNIEITSHSIKNR